MPSRAIRDEETQPKRSVRRLETSRHRLRGSATRHLNDHVNAGQYDDWSSGEAQASVETSKYENQGA